MRGEENTVSVSVGPSRTVEAALNTIGSFLFLSCFVSLLAYSSYADRMLLAALAAFGTAAAGWSLARAVFQLTSRETIVFEGDRLRIELELGPWRLNRDFSLLDVSRPMVKVRHYRGKHGGATIRQLVFEHRGRPCSGHRHLSVEEAERVEAGIEGFYGRTGANVSRGSRRHPPSNESFGD